MEKIKDLQDLIDNHGDVLTKTTNQYVSNLKQIIANDGERAAVEFIRLFVDNEYNKGVKEGKRRGMHVICKKGCSLCCHTGIGSSKLEAKFIMEFVEKYNIQIDYDLLDKQLADMDELRYKSLPWEERKCIFLQDGLCAIYPVRPIICRIHNSIDKDVELCRKMNDGNDEYNQEMQVVKGHVMMMALHVFDKPKSGYDLLLIKKIKEHGTSKS